MTKGFTLLTKNEAALLLVQQEEEIELLRQNYNLLESEFNDIHAAYLKCEEEDKGTLREEISKALAEAQAVRERNVELLYRFEELKDENSRLEERALELQEQLDLTLERSDDHNVEARLVDTFEIFAQVYGYPRFLQLLNDALNRLQKYYG